MGSWEELDVDDSDIPALLRPCKRQSRHQPPPSSSNVNACPQSPVSPSPPQVEHHNPFQQQAGPSTSKSTAQIPGPAGAVQAAMLRKTMDQRNRSFIPSQDNQMDGNNMIPTQEYIRRAMEDTAEFDEDFTRNPWVCALEYLGRVNGLIPSTPIGSIKKSMNVGKVDKVVAVVKSSTSNGLGGLIVTLKDPTGTIGATIHHKVLNETECGKDLTIGAVIIIQKVSIFKPLRLAHYLNITLRNLIKVFGKENGPPSERNYSAYPLKYADPGICDSDSTPKKTWRNTRVEPTPNESRQFTRGRGDLHKNNEREKENMPSGSFHCSKRTNMNPENIAEDAARTSTQDHRGESSTANGEKVNKSNDVQGSLVNDRRNSNLASSCGGEETQSSNGDEKQRQPLMVKPSLPQWTDEQLEELFAMDEDDSSLF